MSQFSFDIELSYDDSSRLLCATLQPGFDSPPLSGKGITQCLYNSEYRRFYVFDSEISELLEQADTLTVKGQKIYEEYSNRLKKLGQKQPDTKADAETEIASEPSDDEPQAAQTTSPEKAISAEKILALLGEQKISFQIAECRDAEINITVSEDGLQAYVSIIKAYGGSPATEASLADALKKHNIVYGIDPEAFASALASDSCANLLIASGTPSTKGQDSRFEALVSEQISTAPKMDASGKVNYHEINEFVIVEPGEPLMRRIAPGKGLAGTDVFGKVLPATQGDILPFSGDTVGSSISEQDPDLLVASTKGHPVIKARGVSVENILVVKNVGLSTGNIDFDGSVCVNEDVADGVKIKASGDVTVKGVVGKATITAGGNIVIAQGLLGGSKALQHSTDEPYGAFLTSKGSVYVHFVTRSRIRAAKNIVISEYSSHSDLHAKEQILIGQEGGKGNLFGGHAQAFKLVAAKVIGSPGGTPTQIQVGGDGDNLQKLRSLTQEKRQLSEQIQDLNEALNKILLLAQSAGMTTQMKEKAEQLRTNIDQLQASLNELQKKDASVKKILMKSKKSRVIANHQIYNNAMVTILGASKKITEETTGGTFRFDARQVILER